MPAPGVRVLDPWGKYENILEGKNCFFIFMNLCHGTRFTLSDDAPAGPEQNERLIWPPYFRVRLAEARILDPYHSFRLHFLARWLRGENGYLVEQRLNPMYD